jgi:hypothetical protein
VIVDATGCGPPIAELLREPLGYDRVKPVLITGGAGARLAPETGMYSVAKVELVGVLMALEGTARMKIAPACQRGNRWSRNCGPSTASYRHPAI